MGLVTSLTTQIVLTGVLIGVGRRVGLVTLHPKIIKNDTARQAFEVYVTTSDYLIAQAESIIKSGAKALK